MAKQSNGSMCLMVAHQIFPWDSGFSGLILNTGIGVGVQAFQKGVTLGALVLSDPGFPAFSGGSEMLQIGPLFLTQWAVIPVLVKEAHALCPQVCGMLGTACVLPGT